MRHILIALLAIVTSAFPVAATEPVGKPVRIEFRRAEAEAAPGLIEFPDPDGEGSIYLRDKAEITNAEIAEAKLGYDTRGGAAVDIRLTEAGAAKLKKISRGHLEKRLAILIDGKLLMAPRIRSEMGSEAQITGRFSVAEAQRIADGIARGIEAAK